MLGTTAPISREWLNALIYNHDHSLDYAPDAWKRFIKQGRNGITPLIAKRLPKVPSKYDQLQSDNEGSICLNKIREYYKDNKINFDYVLRRGKSETQNAKHLMKLAGIDIED